MTKVTVDYPSSISRRKLSNLFNHSPFMLSLVHDMCDSQAIVLAAMCEGKCVTSAGNRIEADYEVTKLAAVIDVLENKFYLPVLSAGSCMQRRFIPLMFHWKTPV
ncbi:hypothetical protein EO238_15810 [Citrobacter sp. AAK_AS5]|nr:hypothetical protein EO238_15810 [Citrobacter sp. AAK_AS5]